MRDGARRLIGDQQFHYRRPRGNRPVARGIDHHARRWGANTRGDERALALHLDHAQAAIAVGAIVGLLAVTEMGNGGAKAFGDLPDRLAGCRGHFLAVVESDICEKALVAAD